MIQLANTFEGGTNGTTITTANSGGTSGDALSGATGGSGSTRAFDNTNVKSGSLSAKIATGASSSTSFIEYDLTYNSAVAVRFYLYVTANPPSTQRLVDITDGGGTSLIDVSRRTDGRLRLTADAAAFTIPTAPTANQWVRVEVVLSGGTATCYIYNSPDSGTASDSGSVSSAASTATKVRLGVTSALANVGAFWIDDFAVNDTGTAIGPATSSDGSVTAVAATGTGSAAAPVVTGTATVTATAATGTAAAYAPTVSLSGDVTVTSVRATATASAAAPTVSGNATVTSVRATVTATAAAPTVTARTLSPTTAIAWTLKMDLSGTAFGGSPTWTDVSTRVTPGKAAPRVTDGRQDESSDVNPAQFTFTLDNRDGAFTPGNSSSPYSPHVKAGVRVRLEVTCNGATLEYYDGYADSFETYLDADRAWGLCDVTCTDVLARLGRTVPLRSILIEQILGTNPSLYVPMTDTVTAWAIVSLAKPLIQPYGSGLGTTHTSSTQGSFSFGATGPSGDTSGALTLADYSATDGYTYEVTYASGYRPTFGATAVAVSAWYQNPVAVTGRPLTLATGAGEPLGVDISLPSGGSLTVKGFIGSTLSTGSTGFGKGHWHLIGVEVTATGTGPYTTTLKVYIDGTLRETVTASTTSNTIQDVQIGGQILSGVANPTLIPGDYAHLAVWNAGAPSWSALYAAGNSGYAGESTTAHLTRLLGYRAPSITTVTSGTYSGTVGLHDLEGTSVLQAMFDTAHVEAAPLYADGQGRIVLLNRGQMTSPAVALTLDASDGDLMPSLRVRSDNEYIVNEFTITGSSGNAQLVKDATSQGAYGYYSGSMDAPFGSDSDALTVAQNIVTSLKDPTIGASALEIDLFAVAQHNPALVSSLLALRTGGVVSLTNLPAPFKAVTVMVQGRDLSFTSDSALLTLFTTATAVGVTSTPTGASA